MGQGAMNSGWRHSRKWIAGPCLVSIVVLTACGDDRSEVGVASAGPDGPTVEDTVEDGPFRSDVTVESHVSAGGIDEPDVPGPKVTFDARLVSDGRGSFVELLLTSEPPQGSDVWAVLINGRVTTRTSQVPGAVIGVNIEPFVEPGSAVTVSVRAETEMQEVIAESAAVTLREG